MTRWRSSLHRLPLAEPYAESDSAAFIMRIASNVIIRKLRDTRPDGPLVVRCRSCNAARSAHLAHRALRLLTGPTATDPAAAEHAITHADGPAGPVIA